MVDCAPERSSGSVLCVYNLLFLIDLGRVLVRFFWGEGGQRYQANNQLEQASRMCCVMWCTIRRWLHATSPRREGASTKHRPAFFLWCATYVHDKNVNCIIPFTNLEDVRSS